MQVFFKVRRIFARVRIVNGHDHQFLFIHINMSAHHGVGDGFDIKGNGAHIQLARIRADSSDIERFTSSPVARIFMRRFWFATSSAP